MDEILKWKLENRNERTGNINNICRIIYCTVLWQSEAVDWIEHFISWIRGAC